MNKCRGVKLIGLQNVPKYTKFVTKIIQNISITDRYKKKTFVIFKVQTVSIFKRLLERPLKGET